MFFELVRNTGLAASLTFPNFKQTTSIAILVAGIGLFGIKSVDARNALVQTPEGAMRFCEVLKIRVLNHPFRAAIATK